MQLDQLLKICEELPGSTPVMKIGHHLTYNIGNKSFIWLSQDLDPIPCDFKCSEEDFNLLSERNGFGPAPYIGRYGWIRCHDIRWMTPDEAKTYIHRSYQIVLQKLPRKYRISIDRN